MRLPSGVRAAFIWRRLQSVTEVLPCADQSHANQEGEYIENIVPGTYEVRSSNLEGAYVEAVAFNGQAVRADGIEIARDSRGQLALRIAFGTAALDGAVKTAKGDVIAVAELPLPGNEPAFIAHVDVTGHFELKGLPPGKYRVFAAPAGDADLPLRNIVFAKLLGDEAVEVELKAKESSRIELKPASLETLQRAAGQMQ